MTHASAPSRTPTAADALAEEYLDDLAVLDPIEAIVTGLTSSHSQGDDGSLGALTDYSPAGYAARAELARATRARTSEITAADDVDAVTLAALSQQLDQLLDVHDAALDLATLNNVSSPLQWIREVFDLCPTATVRDWERIADRLHAVPDAVTGYQESLLAARERGWVPPRRQVTVAARQAREFGGDDGFFASLGRNGSLPGGNGSLPGGNGSLPGGNGSLPGGNGSLPDVLVAYLRAGGEAAAAAYDELADWCDTRLMPGARDDDAVGPDSYALAARGFLGARIDLAETYEWGLHELSSIERRMAEIARGIAPDATGSGRELVDAAVAVLDADPRRTVHSAEAFRDWMQQLSDEAVAALDGNHFDIAEPLRRLDCRIAPSTAGVVYYTGPSEDFSRPGQMWWSVPEGITSFSTWRETSTVYHEGVPGHHLQMAHAVYLSGTLNRWRRMGSWISGHGEGWALYAERLMEELGYLEDPGDLLGMLDAHALRASRVVVDLGVHLRLPAPDEVGGGTWDAAKAWDFLTAHTRVPEPNLRFELDRYLGWPGQAISYKVGERVWLGLRAEVAEREGADFDLRSFHRRALDLGSVGLDVLAKALLGE